MNKSAVDGAESEGAMDTNETQGTAACQVSEEAPMICTCSVDGEREAIALRLEVQRRLGVSDPAMTWTAAMLSLAWHFGAEVDVASDMWFGVGASTDEFGHYRQCDWPFDGVFACWQAFADRYPEKVVAIGLGGDVDAVRARCEVLLAEYEALHAVSLAHDYACPACAVGHVDRVSINAPSKRCDEGKALWDAFFPPLWTLRDIWAQPSYDAAPCMWGER